MSTHAACNVVGDAMKKSGLTYKAIAEKTGTLSEKEVEELCSGAKLASPEQHDAIATALGLSTEDDNNNNTETKRPVICVGRLLHADLGKLLEPATRILDNHDMSEAFGLIRHHRAIAEHALEHIRYARALRQRALTAVGADEIHDRAAQRLGALHTRATDRIGALHARAQDRIGALHERVADRAESLNLPVPVLPKRARDLKLVKLTDQLLRSKIPKEDLKELPSHKGLNPPGVFTWLTLKNILPYTDLTARFDFAFDDPEVISEIPVSSTCVVSAPEDKPLFEGYDGFALCAPAGEEGPFHVYRAYTPITERGAPGIISFAIKKQAAPDRAPGMSQYIHNMKVGEKLGIMGYLQRPPSMIPWKLDQFDSVTMLVGGIGLTPALQILQYSFASNVANTKFLLLYANSTEDDIAMRDELNEMQKQHQDKFEIVYVLSRPKDPEAWKAGGGEIGYIDEVLVKKYAPPPPLGVRAIVGVAGPPALVNGLAGPREGDRENGYTGQGELTGVLKVVGYTAEQVHKF